MSGKHDNQGKIKSYASQAGGWGALKGSLKHVVKNRGITRSMLTLLRVNQPEGFDCPSCAWPDPKDASSFEFCENGAKAVSFEATAKRVTPDFFAKHTVTWLNQQTDHWLEDQGRLTDPMRYNPTTDHYEPIAWDDAFREIAQQLQALDSPDQAIFYTSGRASNEAAFLYQLFVRMYGTNNMPDCSNMCHESSGEALSESIGIGKGTVRLDDFEHADAIFVIGQNPGTNHPRMLSELEKASRRGAEIVTLNPLRERGLEQFTHPQHVMPMLKNSATSISSLYLQVTLGGDLAALKGIIKHVLEAESTYPGKVLDHEFIREHTAGFEELVRDIENTSWESIEIQSGLSREQLLRAADIYVKSKRVIICWAMGLTQHKHAVPTIQQVVNLLLLRGNLGKPGAGACPVRGHSNVQGDRTVGITERPKPAFLDKLAEVFEFEPPRGHGHDVVGAIEGMLEPADSPTRCRFFLGLGGNFVAASPDTDRVSEAMNRCDMTVHISTKLNRSHVVHGKNALILPCLGRTERDEQASGPQRVSVEDSMSQVHLSHGKNPPANANLRSECAIIAGLSKATFGDRYKIDWDALIADYDRIRDLIAMVLPGIYSDFNKRVHTPGGFYLGNSAAELKFETANGKANFVAAAIPDLTLPAGQLRLQTLRSHDQFNTTVYDMDDRYRGIYGTRHVVLMNAEDLAERGLTDGDMLNITSHTIEEQGEQRHVSGFRAVTFDMPRGCAAGYFPELNPLVSYKSFADRSRTPLSKFIPITVEKMP